MQAIDRNSGRTIRLIPEGRQQNQTTDKQCKKKALRADRLTQAHLTSMEAIALQKFRTVFFP